MVAKKKGNGKKPPSPTADISFPKNIDVHYLKTNNYRTYHIDGIFGGLTPEGKVYVELFVQRSPTPKIVKHKVTKEGNLGDEIERIGKEGIIREIESGLVMDIEVAKIFMDWLKKKIKIHEKVTKKTE